MFIGHFAVGFASKKFAPRTSLALLLLAPLFADALWPFFLLLGWEHVRVDPGNTRFTPFDFYDYPWSHSLLMLWVWATLFAAVYYTATRFWPGTIAIWIGVISHWIFDWTTHRPDMPLLPGEGPKVGLGLWNSIPGTMITEIILLAVGLWLYVRTTTPRDRIGRFAFAAYAVGLLLLYIADRFSPAPTEVPTVAWTAIVLFVLLVSWAWWFDRHRTPVAG